MFHVKQKRLLGFLAATGLSAAVLTGCISDESRGWAAPVRVDDTQVVSVSKGKLDGIDISVNPEPAWTGTLSVPLGDADTRLLSTTIDASDTVFQGDLLRIGSEIVRVRSLNVNGAEREMHLDRGFAGTVASSHGAGTKIEAFRRHWRFPDDWHIRTGSARNLDAIYGTPVTDDDGIMYVGGYGGWAYAFDPAAVNLDAAGDEQEPKVAISRAGGAVIGGVTLDDEGQFLYVTAREGVVSVSTERLKSALAAGGGEVDPEPGFNFESDGEIWASPTYSDGVVYVTSLEGHLYALDAATGNVNWSFKSNQGLVTRPVIAGDLVLAGGFDSRLIAVDKATGEFVWEYAATNWIFSSPIVEDGIAYFGDFDSVLHAVDIETGTATWTFAVDRGKIRGAVALSGDTLVLGTDDGWLVGVNRETQQRAWEVKIERDIHADLVASNGDVLIAPSGCITLAGTDLRVFYNTVEAETGTLRRVEAVC